MNDLPVACLLTAPQLQERRNTLLKTVRLGIVETRELEDGYAYSFPAEGNWLTEVAALIDLERQCCPFLKFQLIVEPAGGRLWLELSGPTGTKDFLQNTLDWNQE